MSDFEQLVSDMRRVQKEYFRSRTPVSLNEARRLERAVDRMLEKLHEKEIHLPDPTPDLFPEYAQ